MSSSPKRNLMQFSRKVENEDRLSYIPVSNILKNAQEKELLNANNSLQRNKSSDSIERIQQTINAYWDPSKIKDQEQSLESPTVQGRPEETSIRPTRFMANLDSYQQIIPRKIWLQLIFMLLCLGLLGPSFKIIESFQQAENNNYNFILITFWKQTVSTILVVPLLVKYVKEFNYSQRLELYKIPLITIKTLQLLCTGSLYLSIWLSCVSISVNYVKASNVYCFAFAQPFFYFIYIRIIQRQKGIISMEIWGIVITIIAALFFLIDESKEHNYKGYLLSLVAGAMGTLFAKNFEYLLQQHQYPFGVASCLYVIFSDVYLLVFSMLFDKTEFSFNKNNGIFSFLLPKVLLEGIIFGLVGTIALIILFKNIQQYFNVFQLQLTFAATPIFAIVFGLIYSGFDEWPGIYEFVAIFLIMLGMGLLVYGRRDAETRDIILGQEPNLIQLTSSFILPKTSPVFPPSKLELRPTFTPTNYEMSNMKL